MLQGMVFLSVEACGDDHWSFHTGSVGIFGSAFGEGGLPLLQSGSDLRARDLGAIRIAEVFADSCGVCVE